MYLNCDWKIISKKCSVESCPRITKCFLSKKKKNLTSDYDKDNSCRKVHTKKANSSDYKLN